MGPTDRRVVTQKQEDAYSTTAPKVYDPILMNWDDPGVGATMVAPYTMSGWGMIKQDEQRGVFNFIKDLALIVFGELLSTVGSVLFSVAQAVGANIKVDQICTAQTYVSYRYVGKEGKVWTENLMWATWFETRSREVYKHFWGTYVCTNNFQRQATVDYLPPAYSWIRFNESASYNNNSLIASTAYNNWFFKRFWTIEFGY